MKPAILRFIRDNIGPKWSAVVGFAAGYGISLPSLTDLLSRAQQYVADNPGQLIPGVIGAFLAYLLRQAPADAPVVAGPVVDVQPPYRPEPRTPWRWGAGSRRHLERARPELVRVFDRALELSPIDFAVIDSVRTYQQQADNVARGVSWTMDSRHRENPCGALDHVPIVNGRESWAWEHFEQTTGAIKQAAAELGVTIVCGIDWEPPRRDGAHIELDRKVYPYKPDVELA